MMTEERQLTIADVGAMPEEFTGEIHPVADLFPMMTDDELDDLAADILTNGLIHPVVVDEEGRLVDGRNRLAACRRAGVVPQFVALADRDPVEFILGANVSRRHMTRSQLAMVIASAECSKLLHSRGGKAQIARRCGIDKVRLGEAVMVVEHEPEYADKVIAGAMPFHEAVEKTKRRVAERENVRERTEKRQRREEALRKGAPDFFGLYEENRMTLEEAEAAYEERKRQERERIAGLTRRFDTILTVLDPASMDPDEWAEDWLNADPTLIGDRADFSAERALRAADTLIRYARLRKEKDSG